jgi:predicted porin
MNKKVMALAVAGAFAAPTAALAQASSVQIYGTMYMEYSAAHQGSKVPATFGGVLQGDLVNVDNLQSPGAEIGIKGEEALGGGYSAWFQCASTADIRGAGTGSGIQGFCGRNSAIGLKGAFGNVFAGNWDMPMKRTAGAVRITSDTGIWGGGPMLFGNSSTFNDAGTPMAWSRRQNNSIFYDSPVWNGLQVFGGISTPSTAIALTTNASGNKPRVWGLAANYTNGPLLITAGYESHQNFNPGAGASCAQTGSALGGGTCGTGSVATLNSNVATYDSGWQVGAAYQLGPVKAGVLYTKQTYDFGLQTGPGGANGTFNQGMDGKVSAWNIAGEWNVMGPHALRGGYTKANSTSGSMQAPGAALSSNGGVIITNRVWNAGGGATGGNIWQVQYVFNASKRTEFTGGYVRLQNDANARYALGGMTAPAAGSNQDAFAISWKHLF